MMKKLILLLIILSLMQNLIAQNQQLPLVKATSKSVDAKIGDYLVKEAFKLDAPLGEPMILNLPYDHELVTLYTDIDSIAFEFNPYQRQAFIILLNNKDSVYCKIQYPSRDNDLLKVLKNGGEYNLSDNRSINRFIYKSEDNPDLILLREKFKLDSIAGTGNEISKIINVLLWVHNTFPHNGNNEVPRYNNTYDLMTSCIENNGTMHCGALAHVLNDCYAALGYKSRRVICMPKDSTDTEMHSINTVYSNRYSKWVWVDPTNFAYVMDERGELLSIAEVREKLVNDEQLILNPDANWNHKISITKDEYLFNYMAKNLYAIQCLSEANGKSRSNILLPIEYKGKYPHGSRNNPKFTNNPNVFWAKPE